jgi:hypothetical protein
MLGLVFIVKSGQLNTLLGPLPHQPGCILKCAMYTYSTLQVREDIDLHISYFDHKVVLLILFAFFILPWDV